MQICILDLPCIYVWKYIHSGDLYIELSFLTGVLASLLYEMVSVHSQYAAVGTTIMAKLKNIYIVEILSRDLSKTNI